MWKSPVSPDLILDIGRQGIFVLVQIGAPVMIAALVTGLVVSLLQALTQIQEMTLTFVPKMVVMLGVLIVAIPFMLATLKNFAEDLFAMIAHAG